MAHGHIYGSNLIWFEEKDLFLSTIAQLKKKEGFC